MLLSFCPRFFAGLVRRSLALVFLRHFDRFELAAREIHQQASPRAGAEEGDDHGQRHDDKPSASHRRSPAARLLRGRLRHPRLCRRAAGYSQRLFAGLRRRGMAQHRRECPADPDFIGYF